jgi:hypothetical protein
VPTGHSELAEHLLHLPSLQTGVSPEQSAAFVQPEGLLAATKWLIKNPAATKNPMAAVTMRITVNGVIDKKKFEASWSFFFFFCCVSREIKKLFAPPFF